MKCVICTHIGSPECLISSSLGTFLIVVPEIELKLFQATGLKTKGLPAYNIKRSPHHSPTTSFSLLASKSYNNETLHLENPTLPSIVIY